MEKLIFIKKGSKIYAINEKLDVVFEMNIKGIKLATIKAFLIEKSLIEGYNNLNFNFI